MKRHAWLLCVLPSLCACSDDPETSPALLAPPPEGSGVQYVMNTSIEPGSEVEHCQFVQAPPEGLVINRDEVRFTEGSHHFLVYETPYTAIPTENEEGQSVDATGVFDCSDGPTAGWEITRLIGGSQNGDGDAMLAFPDDVGITVPPNTVLLMNAHYINATPEPIEPEVRVNFWTIPEEQRTHEGDVLFLYNIFISVPGQSSSRAHMRCPVYDDITITNAQSHMHARGTGYAASVDGGAPFYENDRWENVPVLQLGDGLSVPAGSQLDFFCDFDNGSSEHVYQGARSTDEMCMLIGSFYPASPATAGCSRDPAAPLDTQSLGAEWVGGGDKTCSETMDCVIGSFSEDNSFDRMQACVNDASGDVSAEVSAAMSCFFMSENPAVDCAAEMEVCSQM